VVDQVQFNVLNLEDYCLAFNMPTPGLWHGPDQQLLNYGQKPQEALAHFIKLFSQPGKYILNAFAGTHSASLVAVLAGRHSIAVEQYIQQWHYTSMNLPEQFSHIVSLQTTATKDLELPTIPKPPMLQQCKSESPNPFSATQTTMDVNHTPLLTQCPKCLNSIIDTHKVVLQCSASTCEQTFHPDCGLALPNGHLVCSQQCFDNQLDTVRTL
jgi:hypothetical protein